MPGENIVFAGDNWSEVLAAAIAIYAVGFLIYGALFSRLWMNLTGFTQDQLTLHRWKLARSPVIPLLPANGLALVVTWAKVDSLAMGVLVAVQIWVVLILPTRLYSCVYGGEKAGLAFLDAIHLLFGFLLAGAILGGWR